MAASQYLDRVQQLYIAYFGRPADPAGLSYWAQQIDNAGGNAAGVISGFSASAESQALYGNVAPAEQVKAIYQNIFGRSPEPAGLAYWTEVLASGGAAGQMAFTIMQAAQGSDSAAVSNKLAAANAFTADIDTTAEIAGYKGADALATARAFLSKVDSTPGSVVNLTTDATSAVVIATGTVSGSDTTGGGSPSPLTFTATKDGSNVVTLANGTSITVALAGGTYTFTSSGTSVPITGTVAGIVVPTGATLSTTLTLASGIAFPGAGTVALTDTTATASALKAIEAATTGLVDASTVTSITSASVADALLLLSTHNGSSGDKIKTAPDVAVTLTDTTATASALKVIEAATAGLVDASTVTSITSASVADALLLLSTHNGSSGDKIKTAPDVTITLTDVTNVSAADLNAIKTHTTGLVDFSDAGNSIAGALADVNTLLDHKGTTGDAINLSGAIGITLTDTSLAAAAVTTLDTRTTGNISFSGAVTTISGALADVTSLYSHKASSGNGVNIPTVINITLSDTTIGAAMALNAIDTATTGLVTASSLTSLTGGIAQVATALNAIAGGTAISAPALNSVTLTTAISSGTELSGAKFVNDTTIKLSNANSSSLTLVDSNLSAGKTLTIDGSSLSSSTIMIDGRAETNGTLVIKGGAGGDAIYGGALADTLSGGAGHDTFVYGASNRSTLAAMDTITDYSVGDSVLANDFTAFQSNEQFGVMNYSSETSLLNALNRAAAINTSVNGLTVFLWDGNTYAYVENSGDAAGIDYVASDFVVKLVGTPFSEGTNTATIGFMNVTGAG